MGDPVRQQVEESQTTVDLSEANAAGGDAAPTTHRGLLAWVREVAELTQPASVYWVNGSEEENNRLTDELVDGGTLVRLNPETFPHSFAAFSDPADVARVEEQTFICSEDEREAGFTNNWMDPVEMKEKLRGLFSGCMRGRTMYVIPFVMGHSMPRTRSSASKSPTVPTW